MTGVGVELDRKHSSLKKCQLRSAVCGWSRILVVWMSDRADQLGAGISSFRRAQ